MSNSIDQRIVEMQFDNAQFEKGIASTLASLKQFDGAIQTTKGSDALEKIGAAAGKIDFTSATNQATGFAGTLESLKGTATNVFDHMTNAVGSFAKGFSIVNGLLNAGIAGMAIHGGWNRASAINQGEFKLQGLLKDSEKVEQAMKNANDAVTGTAYAFDEAVTASTNLIASGRGIGEQLQKDLTLIADLAGATGRDYGNIADIMSTVAAQGKVSGIQIQQFATAGLNATAALSTYLNKSGEEIKDMVSKGQIDFDTFSAAMNATFGGNAKKANETFEGSLANVRAALSRTTADLFLYGQKAMVPVFNGIMESINGLNWALKPLMGTWEDAEGKVQKGVLIRGIEDFGKALGDAFSLWGGSKTGDKANRLEEGMFGFLNGDQAKGWRSRGPIRFRKMFTEIADAMKGPIEEINKGMFDFSFAIIQIFASVREVARLTLEFLSPIGKAIGDVFGGGTFEKFAHDFRTKFTEPILEALADFHVAEGFVNTFRAIFDVVFGVAKTLGGTLVQGIGIALKFMFDVVTSAGLALGSFFDFVDGIISAGGSLGDAVSGIFKPISDFLGSIGIQGAGDVFKNLGDGVSSFFKALRGEEGGNEQLAKTLEWFDTSTQGAIKSFGEALSTAGENVTGFFSFVKDNAFDKGMEFFENARNIFGPIIGDIGEGLANFFSTLGRGLDEATGGALSAFVDGISNLVAAIQGDEGAIGRLSEFGQNVSTFFGAAFSKAAEAIAKFVEAIKPMAAAFKDFSSGAAETFLKAMSGIVEFLGPIVSAIKDKVVAIATVIGDAFANAGFSFEPIMHFFENLGGSIATFIDKVSTDGLDIGKVFDFLGSIKDDFGQLVNEAAPAFESFTKSVGEAISSNLEGPLKSLWDWVANISGPLDHLMESFSNNMDKIANLKFPWQSGGGEKVGGFNEFAGIDTDTVVEEGFDFFTALDNLVQFLTHPIEAFTGFIGKGLESIANGIADFADSVVWDKISDFASRIIALGAGGATVAALYAFSEFLKGAGDLLKEVTNVVEVVKKIGDSVSDLAKSAEKMIKTQAILNIAIAVGILVASIVALSFTDLEKAKEAVPIVLELLVSVSVIVAVFGKLATAKGFDVAGVAAFANAMLGIAVAIGIMSFVIQMLGNMDASRLKQGETAIVEFGLIVAALTFIAGKIPRNISGLGTTFLGLAVLFGTLAVVATVLGSIPKGVFDRGAAALVGMAVGIALIVAVVGSFGKSLAVAASGLLEMAGSIAILALAMVVMGSVDPGRLQAGGLAIAQLMIAMGVFVYAMTHLVKPQEMAVSVKSMMAMCAAILILAGAIAGLAMIGSVGGDLQGATTAIFELILVMSLLVAVAGNFGPQLDGLGPMFTSLAISIGLLVAALAALSLIGFENTAPSLLILAGAMVVFVGAMALLGLISKYIEPSIAPMIAMSAAVVVLTVALMALSSIPMENLLVAVVALGAGLGIMALAMVAFGAIGETFGAGIIALSVAFAIFAAGVLILTLGAMAIAASALIFTEALKNMADTGPEAVDNLIECIKHLGHGLLEAAPNMAEGVMGIGYAIISGLMGLIPMAVLAIASFFGQLLGAIIMFMPAIIDGAMAVAEAFINGLADGIRNHGGDILGAIGNLFMSILEGIGGLFSEGVNMFNNWLYDVTNGLMGVAPQAKEAGQEIGSSVSEGAKEGNTLVEDMNNETDKLMEDLKAKHPELADQMNRLAKSGSEGFDLGGSSFDWLKSLGLDSESMGLDIGTVVGMARSMGIEIPPEIESALASGMTFKVSDIMDENGVIDTEAINSLNDSSGGEAADSWFNGYQGTLSAKDYTEVLANPDLIDQGHVEEVYSQVGEGAANAFSTSFADGMSSVDGSGPVEEAASKMQMESKFQDAGKVDGQAAVKGMEAGLKDMASKAKSAAQKATSSVKGQEASMRSAGQSTGKGIVSGMVVGMNSQIPALEQAVAKICALAEKAAKAKLAMHSPSKVFARIGSGMIEGMILGVENMHTNLKYAMRETGDVAVKGLSVQSLGLDGLLSDIDDQPVIRPVLDLSDYQYGLQQMYGMSTYMPMVGAQLVGRSIGAFPMAAAAGGGNVIQIELNYTADADANQIVMDIANGLSQKLMMEGS